jgi:hypothetical protein
MPKSDVLIDIGTKNWKNIVLGETYNVPSYVCSSLTLYQHVFIIK